MIERKNIKIDSFISGIGLFSVPVFTLLISSVIFLCGGAINPYVFPISILLSISVIYALSRTDKKLFARSALFHLIFLLIALFASGFIYDYGYDGIRYHQDSISRLHDGWNPVYDSQIDARLWVKHYAKGIEIIAASIFSTTGFVDAGKAVNLMLVFASMFFVYRFLSIYFEFLSSRKRWWLAFIFAFSTVVTNQLFSYYVDWSCYTLVLIFISTFLCLLKKESFWDFAILGACLYLSVCIKFNVFFWLGLVAFFALVYFRIKRPGQQFRIMFAVLFYSAIFGVFVSSFNPYVTNTIYQGSPVYPLMEDGLVDLEDENTPPVLKDRNRVEAFFISNFSFPKADRQAETNEYAFPQNLTAEHIHHSGKVDPSLGGYGLFFSWILLGAVILYFGTYNSNKKNRKYFNSLLALLLVSAFLLPLGFYARYYPLFYAFPLLMLLYSEYDQSRKSVRYFRNFIYVLIGLNILVSLFVVLGTGMYKRNMVEEQLNVLMKADQPILIDFAGNASFRLKMDKAGILYKEVDSDSVALDTTIFSPPIYLEKSVFVEK